MASWFSSCWIHLWIFILSRKALADLASPRHYTINQTKVNFDQATEVCSPGVLTTLTTEQEATKILRLISMSVLPQNELRFWVGLRKAKNECVVPALPLRGFKWTEDGSEESQVSHWMKEPENTCTTVRCAALQVEVDQSAVTRWGLIPVSCKNTYKFICKLRDRQTKQRSEDRKTTTTPATLEPVTPESAAPERPTLAVPVPPTPAAPETPKLATQGPDLKLKPEPEQQGPELGSGPPLGSDSCVHPNISGVRFFSLDSNSTSRITVKCWSRVQLELHCWGRPAVWRLLDDSPANFTTICQPCSEGFQKDAFGNCVDIDECSKGAHCRYTCLNIEGSYKCVCYDENGKYHNENSSACTDSGWLSLGILIPVVVAVVVLVVVVAVAVKCCLMRRLKKRAMKKSQKMAKKKSDGQDSFTTANEKTAT
ncbi:C-type lectin domain family 14 member A [Trachinotus anak]|uniref:C-type lectin domain family 14 member A n=1 Tax=Trachinotus anak TaxID=443729 RepID=UPI0039F16D55